MIHTSSTAYSVNDCAYELSAMRLSFYSSQFYRNYDGKYYTFPIDMPVQTIKLSYDVKVRGDQLRNLMANRKCYCDKCNPDTSNYLDTQAKIAYETVRERERGKNEED